MDNVRTIVTYWAGSHYRRVVAFAVLGCVVGAFAMWLFLLETPQMRSEEVVEPSQMDDAERVADPVRLRVPSVSIDTLFGSALGLNTDGTVEVPDVYDAVGWYKYGPKPGAVGPAVILGHVDSFEGPAVFYSLGKIRVGDVIEIDRADGTTAFFEVTRLDRRLQSEFPTKEVYGDIDHAGLRLITCTGTYDRGRRVYSHNLIVYARLVE